MKYIDLLQMETWSIDTPQWIKRVVKMMELFEPFGLAYKHQVAHPRSLRQAVCEGEFLLALLDT